MPGTGLRELTPLVSVIIPVYNVAPYLRRCLDSVCGQSYRNLEIILVVSNSTDASPAICAEYAARDGRIVLERQPVQGLGPARDRGIDVAKGEWICFVDSDDYIHPQYVEILLRVVTEYDCLTCQCRFQKVGENEIVRAELEADHVDIKLFDFRRYFIYIFRHAAAGYNPFGVWSNLYHCSLFEGIRFGAYRFAEDSAFSPKIIYAARERQIAVINKVLYYYVQREGSLLHSMPSLIRMDRYYIKKGVLNFWQEKGEPELYRLFFRDYYKCMLLDYLDLSVCLPREHLQFEFIKEDIISCFPKALTFCSDIVLLHPGSKQFLEELSAERKKYILYGYGEYGRRASIWLKFFDIHIVEIWDRDAGENMRTEDGTPIVQPRRDLSGSPTVLIAIEDYYTGLEIEMEFRGLGYSFIPFSYLDSALRYAQFKRFLPFLLEQQML